MVCAMKEPLFQNNQKVNRLAKTALQELDLKPDPASLYVLQLLTWAQESQSLKAKDSRLWDQVDEMTAWKPNKVSAILVRYFQFSQPFRRPEPLLLVFLKALPNPFYNQLLNPFWR
jgi:hypothetical protein